MMKYACILLLGAMAACASAPAAEKENPAPAAVYGGQEAGQEYLFTVADANAEQTLRTQLAPYGAVSAEKISAELFLVKFSRPAELKELEKKVDGKIIKAVQPNFRYWQYKAK